MKVEVNVCKRTRRKVDVHILRKTQPIKDDAPEFVPIYTYLPARVASAVKDNELPPVPAPSESAVNEPIECEECVCEEAADTFDDISEVYESAELDEEHLNYDESGMCINEADDIDEEDLIAMIDSGDKGDYVPISDISDDEQTTDELLEMIDIDQGTDRFDLPADFFECEPTEESANTLYTRYFDINEHGERIAAKPDNASGREIICRNEKDGKLSRICGIMRHGKRHHSDPDNPADVCLSPEDACNGSFDSQDDNY